MATTATVITQTILDTVLADVNAVVPNFSSLVSSYRLLVGSAEEIHRIPGVSPDVLARAIERFDRTGVLLDILVDLLCCKISFSSDFLAVTCAPVDLFRLLATRFNIANTPHEVAEEILLLEILRRAEVALSGKDGAAKQPCTPPGPPPYTFATSFYQPPPPPPAAFPPPVPPAECLLRNDADAPPAAPEQAAAESPAPQTADAVAAPTQKQPLKTPEPAAGPPNPEPAENRSHYTSGLRRPRKLK